MRRMPRKTYKLLLPILDYKLGIIRGKIGSVLSRNDKPEVFWGFDKFCTTNSHARALVSFLPSELRIALDKDIHRLRFNPTGVVLEIARSLNELGFVVDMVDYRDITFVPEKKYDLFIGHANLNFEQIATHLDSTTRKVYYSSGCQLKEFFHQSQERYERYYKKHSVSAKAGAFTRHPFDDTYDSINSDLVVCLGKMTAESYTRLAKKVIPINNASYYNNTYNIDDKDFELGRNSFMYFGGTGNIQKGLDLLIEAFSQTPTLQLFIFSPLEPELVEGLSKELSRDNIHYVYHYRFSPQKLSRLIASVNYTLYTGFNSGQSTALIGSLSNGLIPVANRESDLEFDDNGYLIPSNSVEGIIESITSISKRSEEWYRQAAIKTIDNFKLRHTPEAFRYSFKEAIASII